MDLGIEGQVALVTGGSRGIGAATAARFAEHGARVAVSGRDRAAIDDVVGAIRWDGGTAIGVVADVTRVEALECLRDTVILRIPGIPMLLAFAGGGGEPSPSECLEPSRWRAAVEGNLTSTFLTVHAFLPGMLARGRGAIVTMASAAARQPSGSNAAYAAAKAGVVALTRHLAAEVGSRGVRVNCIAPSAVMNDRMRTRMTEEQVTALGASFPLGRVGEPDDVASAALYLASDAASWVTGVVLDVAGGKVMV